MPESPANRPSVSADPRSLRLPWPLQAAAVLGVAVPVGMLAHLGHTDRQALDQSVQSLSEERVTLTVERDQFSEQASAAVAEATEIRSQLQLAGQRLETERAQRVALEQEVAGLNQRVAVLGDREEALRGIIDVLEGEVDSAERRIEKLIAQRPAAAPEIKHLTASAIVASNDPQIRMENDRLRNELRKHDDQVVELLGEISILNQELEIIREQVGSKPGQKAKQSTSIRSAELAGLADEE